jgi:predicted MPP superfamily phosphohydrolase
VNVKGKWSGIKAILIRLATAALLSAVYIALARAASADLDITHTSIVVAGLPDELDGLRIAQISDLHSSRFGEGQEELVDAIKGFQPDIIAVTGDFIDGIRPDAAPCEALVRGLAPVAPVYIVMGNHEYYLDADSLAAFRNAMENCGAHILVNQTAVLARNGKEYLLAGMDDMARFAQGGSITAREQAAMEAARGFMDEIGRNAPEGGFPLKIMLCHEPHYWQVWRDAGYDIALCGHLHGWIFRAPGVGGILRKPSMYFPEEDAGLYGRTGCGCISAGGWTARSG